MVEVFKTNVSDPTQAKQLSSLIHRLFAGYTVNFDLEDCDNILRAETQTGLIQAQLLIQLLRDYGFEAEILPDDSQLTNELTEGYSLNG
jgi:hypothetical protein